MITLYSRGKIVFFQLHETINNWKCSHIQEFARKYHQTEITVCNMTRMQIVQIRSTTWNSICAEVIKRATLSFYFQIKHEIKQKILMLSDELSIKVFSLLHLTVAFLFQINPHKPPPYSLGFYYFCTKSVLPLFTSNLSSHLFRYKTPLIAKCFHIPRERWQEAKK